MLLTYQPKVIRVFCWLL